MSIFLRRKKLTKQYNCKTAVCAIPSLIVQLGNQGGQEKPAVHETWLGPRPPAASPQSYIIYNIKSVSIDANAQCTVITQRNVWVYWFCDCLTFIYLFNTSQQQQQSPFQKTPMWTATAVIPSLMIIGIILGNVLVLLTT